jgi:hypothetical protein
LTKSSPIGRESSNKSSGFESRGWAYNQWVCKHKGR